MSGVELLRDRVRQDPLLALWSPPPPLTLGQQGEHPIARPKGVRSHSNV